ncbi:hypothetical protein [Companilactobacillus sp.]|jgi:AcrR family transcriptional regulator|uniref:hypothetical protein n=1 Tax=Companilactobacillus sp. TaxID=2767905 RepID=UPI0025BDF906|nr:hypothetical protein [Companilactobacillus sp.]MCH4008561.1 hypothetical protein [Companilactobacillus sp.]MCH4051260.1 hypothetical protein [Companilactobacillus sp.]MCH4076504.1 hypothetical protein [Companilactobacillus sp.]MCH4125079.1 hypothetical protein [Companilactobacillus sp.]MCH4131620.1 hypothetical protein [Companilactobacillus sp.]
MANPKDLRVVKTTNLIKNSFYDLLSEEDFDKINVKQICQKSLIGRSTFYQHYVDKYDLLDKETELYAQKFADGMADRVDTFQDDNSLQNLIDYLEPDATEILLLLEVHTNGSDLEDRFEKIISESIAQLVNANPMSNLPIEFIQKLYSANVMSFLKWSLKNGVDQSINSFMNESLQQEYNIWLKY